MIGRPVLPVRAPRRVRPYALAGGRTSLGHVLLVETLVAATDASPHPRQWSGRRSPGGPIHDRALPEMREIVALCRTTRTVAEVSALLRMPLGVVRVLLSDLADQGRIHIYGTGRGTQRPDHALLERVLGGLRRL